MPSASTSPEDLPLGKIPEKNEEEGKEGETKDAPLRKLPLPKGKVRKRITVKFHRGHGTLPTHQSLTLILIM